VFLWGNLGALLAGVTPAAGLDLIAQWSGPAVLLALVWYGLHLGGARSALRMGQARANFGARPMLWSRA
jgi:hypothetical protein